MPYKIKKTGKGYKVCKKLGKQKCFSKKPISKEKAKAQMYAIIKNESLSFKDFFYLQEGVEFKNGNLSIKATDPQYPNGYGFFDTFTIIKKLYRDRKELLKVLKHHSHEFSPMLIAASMLMMGINANSFIKQNPEVLDYVPDFSKQEIIDKAANFLNNNPKILKIFQK